MVNVKMIGTGVYVPNNAVYNQDIDRHFEKLGLSAHNLMEHLGRKKRYFISEGENTISMCKSAIHDCSKKNNIDLNSIEMIVVCSDTPEYLFPSNAMKLAGIYGEAMSNVTVAFDLNSNCTGMVQGMDVVNKYMRCSDINRALVVGCFCISPIALWSDTVVYATFADAAACVVLEKQDSEHKNGFMDVEIFVDASYHEYITYPKCGMSNVPLKSIQPNEKRLEWNPFPMDFIPQKWVDTIKKVLRRNDIDIQGVDYFVFSQLSDAYNLKTLELLGVSEEKYFFWGREYGYTGNTCPILCIDKMWDRYNQDGKIMIICTVGAGYSAIVQLYIF